MKYEWIRLRRKQILWVLAGTVLLMAMQCIQGMMQNKVYYKEDGQIKGIQRNLKEDIESIPLIAEYELDGRKNTYRVNITFQTEGSDEANTESVPLSENALVEQAIDELAGRLEDEEGSLILLPSSLEQGTKVKWKSPSSAENLLIILLFPLGVCYLYYCDKEKEKQRNKRKCEEIKRALPAFNDQLLLFMNSGLIFHDAFYRICENFKSREVDNAFYNLIVDVYYKAETTGKSLIIVLKESAKLVSVREYSRLINILIDNQIKGVDLRTKLNEESGLLWETRKELSLQKGKEMETKLAFPLAVLLVVLMLIAGAPAMMTM